MSTALLTAENRTTNESVPQSDAAPPAPSVVTFKIPRDLAVEMVGSDAGKERRMRPAATMTKGLTPDELAAVTPVLQPFVDAEAHRFHDNRSARLKAFEVTTSPNHAVILKKMAVNLADHLCQHLSSRWHDSRFIRIQQRLDQARDLIRQINQTLGLNEYDDGRTAEERAKELTQSLHQAIVHLDRFQQRLGQLPSDDLLLNDDSVTKVIDFRNGLGAIFLAITGFKV